MRTTAGLLDLFVSISVKDEASDSIDEISQNFEKLGEKVTKNTSSSGDGLEKLSQKAKDTTPKIKEVGDAGETIGEKIGEGSKQGGSFLEELSSMANKAGDGLISSFAKIGAGIGAAFTVKKVLEFGAACVQAAAETEKGFAKVSTLLGDSTENTAYFESIKKGSQETGVSVSEFSEAVYNALSASVDQANAVEFTTNAIKLAKGGFTDAATAVDVLTTAINAYGLKASDAIKISDKLVTTQNLGKTTVGELAQNLGRSIPTARAYNVSIDELLASYAVMTKNGNQAAESTTLINAMLNELGKSGTKTAEIIKKETGKSFSQLMAEGVSLTEVLSILQSSANQSGLAINDLFGSAEAGKGANILLNNIEDVNSAIKAMGSSAGATESAYSKVMDTFSEKTAVLKNNWDLLIQGIGEKLLPIVSSVVDAMNSGFDVLYGRNTFKGQASDLEEATQKAQDYQKQIDDIYDSYEAGEEISDRDMLRVNQLTAAMNDYLAQIETFKTGNEELGDSGEDTAARMQQAASDYIAGIDQITQKHIENFKQIRANIEGWFGPFEKANQEFQLSYDNIKANLESQRDFLATYQEDAQYLADNGLGSIVEKLQTMGTEGAEYAHAFAQELRSVGPDGIADTVEEITTLMDTVGGMKDSLAGTLEIGSGEAVEELKTLTETFTQTVSGMDKSTEATEAANSTMTAFVTALDSSKGGIMDTMGNLGAEMTSALQASIGNITISATMTVNSSSGGKGGGGGRAIGMDYVPYNGMPAILHRGEAILNSYEADQWRRGRSGGNSHGITIVQNIQSVPQTPVQLAAATQAMFEQARWAM